MVRIWSEYGGNDSKSESNLGGFSLTHNSYQIPTIPTIPLGFCLVLLVICGGVSNTPALSPRLAVVQFRTFQTMFKPEPEHNVRGSVWLNH